MNEQFIYKTAIFMNPSIISWSITGDQELPCVVFRDTYQYSFQLAQIRVVNQCYYVHIWKHNNNILMLVMALFHIYVYATLFSALIFHKIFSPIATSHVYIKQQSKHIKLRLHFLNILFNTGIQLEINDNTKSSISRLNQLNCMNRITFFYNT